MKMKDCLDNANLTKTGVPLQQGQPCISAMQIVFGQNSTLESSLGGSKQTFMGATGHSY